MDIFQVIGCVTDVEEKSTADYDMVRLTLDNHLSCAGFGKVAKALLQQKNHLLESSEVSLLLEASRKDKYTNFTVHHFHVLDAPVPVKSRG